TPESGGKSITHPRLASLIAGVRFRQAEGQARLVHCLLHSFELGLQLGIWPEQSFDGHRRIRRRTLRIVVLRKECRLTFELFREGYEPLVVVRCIRSGKRCMRNAPPYRLVVALPFAGKLPEIIVRLADTIPIKKIGLVA